MNRALIRFACIPRQPHRWWLLAVIALLLFGPLCSAQEEGNSAPTAVYKLGPGDRILIKVYGEADLSVSLILAETGTFNYPFLGEIKAQGLTVAELEHQITAGLKGPYLRNPEVTVLIEEFRPFYLNGEVERPGGYPYRPGLTLDQAVTLAGGLTERASRNKIVVQRPGAKGTEKLAIKLDDPVYPGDIITIRRSFF